MTAWTIALALASASGDVAPEHIGYADEAEVVDADLAKGVVVVELRDGPPEPGSEGEGEPYTRCKNAFNGGKSVELVVADLRARTVLERVELAGWPEQGACPTQESYAKARAAVKAKVASLGVDVDRKVRPASATVSTTGGRAKFSSKTVADDENLFTEHFRHVWAGDARLLETQHGWAMHMGNRCEVEERLVEDNGLALVLQSTACRNMRGSSTSFALFGPLKLTGNGVDVAAVRRALGDAKCTTSIATVAALEKTVAVTLRDALDGSGKRKVPLTRAHKERDASVVYAKDPCGDVAGALAALIPGGAAVEPLTWDSGAHIVIALGKSAAVR